VQRCAYSILKDPVEIRIGNPDQLNANKDIKQVFITLFINF
jgi:superfamily II DNA/RNA helicase